MCLYFRPYLGNINFAANLMVGDSYKTADTEAKYKAILDIFSCYEHCSYLNVSKVGYMDQSISPFATKQYLILIVFTAGQTFQRSAEPALHPGAGQ